jgi:hypothetical protein
VRNFFSISKMANEIQLQKWATYSMLTSIALLLTCVLSDTRSVRLWTGWTGLAFAGLGVAFDSYKHFKY